MFFNFFLSTDFLTPKCGHQHEKQPVLEPDICMYQLVLRISMISIYMCQLSALASAATIHDKYFVVIYNFLPKISFLQNLSSHFLKKMAAPSCFKTGRLYIAGKGTLKKKKKTNTIFPLISTPSAYQIFRLRGEALIRGRHLFQSKGKQQY